MVSNRIPTAGLREVKVASRDPINVTCGVYVGGDESVEISATALPTAVPIVGGQAWAIQDGSSLTVIGMRDILLPKAKVQSTRKQSIDAGSTKRFNFDGLNVDEFDTDFDGVNSMLDTANSRIYCRWPGIYEVGCAGSWTTGPTGRRILDIKLNGATNIYRHDATTGDEGAGSVAGPMSLAAGDYIELWITTTRGKVEFGSAEEARQMKFWMTFQP